MIEIININVSYYRDLCYTQSEEKSSELEMVIGMMGVYQEELLNKVSKRNKVLKEISKIMKKFSWEDDVIVAYDREEYLKEAYEANTAYTVEDAIESTSKEIVLNFLKRGISIDDIITCTGLIKEQVETLQNEK